MSAKLNSPSLQRGGCVHTAEGQGRLSQPTEDHLEGFRLPLPGTLLIVKSVRISHTVIACACALALLRGMEADVVLGCNQRVWAPFQLCQRLFV